NNWHPKEIQTKVEKALGDYHEGMQVLLQKPAMLLKPMILSLFAWAFEIITLLFTFASLNQFVPLDKVIIVRSIAGNIEAQGYAFMGYAQIVTTELYRTLGVPLIIGASIALLGGTAIFWVKTGISYTAFHRTLLSKKQVTSQKQELIQ
ncbi:MAG: hypothetical protein ACM3WQ_00025, partial [Chloroflexota bacterium]